MTAQLPVIGGSKRGGFEDLLDFLDTSFNANGTLKSVGGESVARLPTIGGDFGEWGTVLNEFLSVSLNSDGTVKGLPAGSVVLPSGADWTDFTDAYDAASSGATIFLPETRITQTATLLITKPIRILGTGADSGFTALTDLSFNASAQQIMIGYGGYPTTPYTTVDGVELAYFTIEHTRNATNRMLTISIFGHSKNIHIHDLTLRNITSDCFILRNESTVALEGQDGVLEDVFIHNNTVEEWYESFFNHHEGSVSRCYVFNNTCTLLAGGHPNAAVSRPYAAIVNIEAADQPGLIQDLYICGNSFVSTLYDFSLGVGGQDGSGTDFIDSIGLSCRQNNNPDFRVNRLYVCNNVFDGWDKGLNHIESQRGAADGTSELFPGTSYIYYLGNTFQANGNVIASVDNLGGESDVIVVGDNAFVKHVEGQTTLAQPDTAASYPDYGPTTIVVQPPNHVTEPELLAPEAVLTAVMQATKL